MITCSTDIDQSLSLGSVFFLKWFLKKGIPVVRMEVVYMFSAFQLSLIKTDRALTMAGDQFFTHKNQFLTSSMVS